MRTSIGKLIFTGDFIIDRSWTDEWRTENWTHWTDIVSHELDAVCINTASNSGTIKQMSNNVDESVRKYNPTHVIYNGGAFDLYSKVYSVDEIVSSIEFMNIVFYESGYKCAYLFVPIDASAYGSSINGDFLDLRKKLQAMFKKYGDIFIDMNGSELGTVGNLKKTMYIDGINLSEEGQMAVAKRVSKVIAESFSEEIQTNTTEPPSGKVVCKSDGRPIFIKVNNTYKPLAIGDENDTDNAICKIKWRC